jgi:hypothetical protein
VVYFIFVTFAYECLLIDYIYVQYFKDDGAMV